jgi:cyclopropane fatty-acyl-phospholipid synthase-like methyltransferase
MTPRHTLATLEDGARLLAPARRLRCRIVAEALERFAAGRPFHVLDAGCGDGAFAEWIARHHPAWTIVGADLADGLLDRGRRSAARRKIENMEFVHADLTEDLGTEVYDAVAAIECLEEIPNDTQALQRMIAALRPGGLFVAHVPEHEWKPMLRGSAAAWKHEVRHGYDPVELAARLTALGLESVQIDATCRGLVRLAQELRERVPSRRPALRALVSFSLLGAVWLERNGLTWGPGRALIVSARRPAR